MKQNCWSSIAVSAWNCRFKVLFPWSASRTQRHYGRQIAVTSGMLILINPPFCIARNIVKKKKVLVCYQPSFFFLSKKKIWKISWELIEHIISADSRCGCDLPIAAGVSSIPPRRQRLDARPQGLKREHLGNHTVGHDDLVLGKQLNHRNYSHWDFDRFCTDDLRLL